MDDVANFLKTMPRIFRFIRCGFLPILISIFGASDSLSQRLAVIAPEKEEAVSGFAGELAERLAKTNRVLDSQLVESAFGSIKIGNHFNLSAAQSRQIGSVVGCDYFLLVKSRVQRRAALERAEYYEAYAAVYLVNSRSGRLVFWTLKNAEAALPATAAQSLIDSARSVASEIAEAIRQTAGKAAESPPSFEDVPPDDSPLAKGLKPPLPFRRIKPEYTRLAYLYDVRATVDAEADIDADGSVVRVSIVRWAGYGLDESVIEAIRKMNWRAAERDGKTLPMRVLLRYNFTKIEDAEA